MPSPRQHSQQVAPSSRVRPDEQPSSMVRILTPGRLPPPTAEPSSASSVPVTNKPEPAQSSSTPTEKLAPEDDEYSVYSDYSEASSASHRHRRHSHSDYSSHSDGGSRSRSSSSGRQRGNEFLPDISVQVRASDQDKSHGQAKAGDLCEFHVMDDEDADLQRSTSLQQEYDQTLRRLGARRAAPAQGLQRQVTN